MTDLEIIRLVFGIFLGIGGGVLLLLAFTVGYKYLVMEQRCTCRTNGTVTGYSAVYYGGGNKAGALPGVRHTGGGGGEPGDRARPRGGGRPDGPATPAGGGRRGCGENRGLDL